MLLLTITRKMTLLLTFAWVLLCGDQTTFIKSKDINVFTIMIGNYEKPKNENCLVKRKWIELNKLHEQLGDEKEKALICFILSI